jgi:polyisoprenoid-binding protein YceI
MKSTTTLVLTLTATLTAMLHAAPLTFDFKDPKGVNNVVFKLDAPLESINGTASGVSGTITIDPEKPESASGKIVVTTASLTVPNPVMQEHMLGEKWLNAKANPEITFEIKKISDVSREGTKGSAKVSGIFTLNGVSKEITVDAKVTHLPGRLADRSPEKTPGDLLVIRSEFTIKRSDFGIQAGQNTDKVADEIALSLSIAGGAPKS